MPHLSIDHKKGLIEGEVAIKHLSHFIIGGEVFINEACYAEFEDAEGYPELRVIFLRKNAYHSKFVDWVINKSEFKDFYITKDIEEGFEKGFEIVSDYDYEDLLDALRVIRMTYEFESAFKEHLGGRRTVAAHIEAVLRVIHQYGLSHGHTMSEPTTNSLSKAVSDGLDFSKCKEYIKCAV